MMKKQLSTLAIFLITMISIAQTGFNYKALITDNGNVLNTQSVTIKFTVLENGTTSVYQETQTATTDANGIVSVVLGEGTVQSGNFATINWANPQSLKVEIDTGSGYQDFGTNPFKYVPTAKYADKAGNVFSGNFSDLSGIPSGLSDGDDDTHLTEAQVDAYVANNGYLTSEVDGSTTNELQNLSLSGNQLNISSGNQVTFTGWDTNVADDFSGNYNDLSNKPGVFQIDDGTTNIATQYTDNIKHAGNLMIGSTFISTGAGKTSIRTNRRVNGSDASYGVVAVVGGSGTGSHFGNYNYLLDAGNGYQYGSYNWISNSGSGKHYGISNHLSGVGTGIQYGVYTNISNSGNEKHYGIYNELVGGGTGIHYGIYNILAGTGIGIQYGTKNFISNSNDSEHYGTANFLNGTGSGNHNGTINDLMGSGSGAQYGTYNRINNTGSGIHFGTYNLLSGTGSGTKYGSYNYIPTTAGGTHYAVYGVAEKAGSFAGYFLGDVRVSQKLLGVDSGTHSDMKAYVYGKVTDNGTRITSASSGGFTVLKINTGVYEIIFNHAMGSINAYTAIATITWGSGMGLIRTRPYSTRKLRIYTYNVSGTPADRDFMFTVFKK